MTDSRHPLVMFNGTVMRGQPDHTNLQGADFVEETRTAPCYRLYSIDDRYPAMYRDQDAGASIAGELYLVPDDVWPSIEASEPPGLRRGEVELDDGRLVDGMLGAEVLVGRGVEITRHGDWRLFLVSLGN